MQKKVYMTVDGNRRETTSLVLKASNNTHKTASLEADVTLDLETKALGTVNLGQSYTVNPSTGKDGMNKVTFNVPAAPSGNAPSYQAKDLGNVSAGQHYDVTADSGYDALSMVSFDVPSAQGGASLPVRQTLVESVPEDTTFSEAVAGKTIPLSYDAGMIIISATGSGIPEGDVSTFMKMIIFYNKAWGEGKTGTAYAQAIVKGLVCRYNASVSVEANDSACVGNLVTFASNAYYPALNNAITFYSGVTWNTDKVAAGNDIVYVEVAMDGYFTQLV